MPVISRKSEVKQPLESCLAAYQAEGLAACVQILHKNLLCEKVKFPVLEYCGEVLYNHLPAEAHIPFCDRVQALKTEGGNVLLGILLQKRLSDHFEQSLQKAADYIADADIWYVCDIIGERVFGYSLLHEPEKTLPEIKKLATHPINWVIRSLGAGAHFAIKKGLGKSYVKAVFEILLSLANTRDKEIGQGVGWAAKTTAKFHPDIIQIFDPEIQNKKKVADWFRTKVNIGLNRNQYAQGNRG